MTDSYDSIAYQTTLARAHANIKSVLRRRLSDPLRFMIDIDAGMPVFASREFHKLRIGYNRFANLSVEATIPHEWLREETGKAHDDFMLAVDDMVLSLKSKVEMAGLPT